MITSTDFDRSSENQRGFLRDLLDVMRMWGIQTVDRPEYDCVHFRGENVDICSSELTEWLQRASE